MSGGLFSVNYEVFGQVQGVFFRQNTVDTASAQGCVGWVRNTHKGTVEGVVQGNRAQIDFMKHWLSHVGSPFSRIDKCNFSNERSIASLEFKRFCVR
ncbi:hypothetical protein SNE40_010921 [Patella caerulea]|uniref:Acylphosphatase n=1 Tax=Patella caerulea TaxID=87958 RepID=A0AAN8JWX7_PATCE